MPYNHHHRNPSPSSYTTGDENRWGDTGTIYYHRLRPETKDLLESAGCPRALLEDKESPCVAIISKIYGEYAFVLDWGSISIEQVGNKKNWLKSFCIPGVRVSMPKGVTPSSSLYLENFPVWEDEIVAALKEGLQKVKAYEAFMASVLSLSKKACFFERDTYCLVAATTLWLEVKVPYDLIWKGEGEKHFAIAFEELKSNLSEPDSEKLRFFEEIYEEIYSLSFSELQLALDSIKRKPMTKKARKKAEMIESRLKTIVVS